MDRHGYRRWVIFGSTLSHHGSLSYLTCEQVSMWLWVVILGISNNFLVAISRLFLKLRSEDWGRFSRHWLLRFCDCYLWIDPWMVSMTDNERWGKNFCHKWERKHLEREKIIFIYNREIGEEYDALLVEYKFAKIRKVGILDKILLYPYWVCKCSYSFLQWARFEIF